MLIFLLTCEHNCHPPSLSLLVYSVYLLSPQVYLIFTEARLSVTQLPQLLFYSE